MSILNKSLVLLLILTVAAANVPNTIDAFTDSTPSGSRVWSKTFGETGAEWAFSVIQTFDGGYATAGYTTSSGAGKADAWLVKTDSLGNQEWNKTYGGEEFDWASCVIQTRDGGYVLAGSTYTSNEGGYDFWLVKTDPLGNQEWNKTYRGIYQDYAASVIQTIDGGYALAGIKGSFNDGGYSLAVYRDLIILGNADAWLIKTDSSGNEMWNETYGGLDDDGAFSIVQTVDGGYVLAGNTYSFSAGNNTDIWLIKTDSSGNELWNSPFGGPKDDFGYSVIQISDGGYALAGITNSSGAGYEDVWLIKTDSSGNKLWDKTYGGALDDEAYCVMQTEDGGYALAGSTLCCGAGLWDAWLIKTDSSGNTLWNQTYGRTGDDQFISMITSGDGGFVLSGSTNTLGTGYWDAWLVKVSSVAQSHAQANVS
jgi:hypothetical protein